MKHFHHYLYGRKFRIRTDHGALRWLMQFKHPEAQVARWIEVLDTYSFEIEYRPGRNHGNADALSQIPCEGMNCVQCERMETQHAREANTCASSLTQSQTKWQWQTKQRRPRNRCKCFYSARQKHKQLLDRREELDWNTTSPTERPNHWEDSQMQRIRFTTIMVRNIHWRYSFSKLTGPNGTICL